MKGIHPKFFKSSDSSAPDNRSWIWFFLYKKLPPRKFMVSEKNNIVLKDVGKIFLNNNENLSITGKNNKIYETCKNS